MNGCEWCGQGVNRVFPAVAKAFLSSACLCYIVPWRAQCSSILPKSSDSHTSVGRIFLHDFAISSVTKVILSTKEILGAEIK